MHEWTYAGKRHQEELLDFVLIGAASSASAERGEDVSPAHPPLPVQTSEIKQSTAVQRAVSLDKYTVDLVTKTEQPALSTLCD